MTKEIDEMTNGIDEMTNGIGHENTFVNIGNRSELVSGLRFLPKEEIINMFIRKDNEEMKDNEEIYLERERYLINTDDLLEEFLNKDKTK